MAKRRCKAKAKQTGKRCSKRGGHVCSSCGVCRMHGCNCKNPGGAPKGTPNGQNSTITSIYVDALLEDELLLFARVDVGGLDDEIRMAKLQLRRALLAQRRADRIKEIAGDQGEEATPESVALELVRLEYTTEDAEPTPGGDVEGLPPKQVLRLTKRVMEGRDWHNEIQRLLGRIERLVSTRATIGGNAEVDAHATALAIQEALAEIESTTHGAADQ